MKSFVRNARDVFGMVLIVAALLWASHAIAAGANATVGWSAVTTYTDGTPAPAADLKSYTVAWSAAASGGPSGQLTVPGSATTAVVPVGCGGVTFTVTVTTTATAKYPNITSNPSASVGYATGITCTINPPTGVTVQ